MSEDTPNSSAPKALKYDVVLSFAGEDRSYVEMVANRLVGFGVKVFYDKHEAVSLWGKNLYQHLTSVYREMGRYAVVFVSQHYAKKLWTKHELEAAQARAFGENQEYILPARFDKTEIPGILPTTGYLDLQEISPVQLAVMIASKVGKLTPATKANIVACPCSPLETGEVHFDHTSHDGRFQIGSDIWVFEIKFSRGGGEAVYCYNDPQSIALVPKDKTIGEITNASKLDYTSRSRLIKEGNSVALQNVSGFYAAIELLDVRDDFYGKEQNEVWFRYWILKDGSSDFSRLKLTAEFSVSTP